MIILPFERTRPTDLTITFSRSDATRQSFSSAVNAAITRARSQDASIVSIEEDSDDWLSVNADALDGVLENALKGSDASQNADGGGMNVDEEGDMASQQAAQLKGLAEKVEKFVSGQGDLEGARFDE